MPDWLPADKDELMPVLERRVRSAVTRDESVTDWEVVNEPLSRKEDAFARSATRKYISSAFTWAKQAAPAKRLMINESGIFGEGERGYNRERYFDLVKSLIDEGTPVDIIGLQAHAKGEWYEPVNVAEQLERYGQLGKPIQISEFSARTLTSDDGKGPIPITGTYRSGSWDAHKQAEFYREFYTVAFGSPAVEAIVTWGLDDERAWLPGIGLISRDGRPKPAYTALDHLINQEWKTRLDGRTDSDGRFRFRGFYGDYRIELAGKQAGASTFTLEKGRDNEWTLKLTNK
jgi:GH35 family endo-1,4-beta-xylanase